ncbi:MAG: cold-shock protein [Gammaproteobacteria bacterium]
MFFRALVTSGFLSLIFWATFSYLNQKSDFNYFTIFETSYLILVLWTMGFLSTLSFVYGRRIRKSFGMEKGKIKWFDPSKGYGFLIRDKGGDLFVHLRSVNPSDRRKLKENTRVRFVVEDSDKGPQANKIKII